MALLIDTEEKIESLVLGSAFLGGGGGGDLKIGLELARLIIKLGYLEVRSLSELQRDSLLITTSVVGPQSLDTWDRSSLASNLIRSVHTLERFLRSPIDGLISSEVGAVNTLSPFPASIVLDIPVIDAPCNGRAHPTVLMGSMGLHRIPGYKSILAAAWGRIGDRSQGSAILKGYLEEVVSILRSIVSLRGAVATARNPINAGYVEENAAPGALLMAVEIGSIISNYRYNPSELSHKIAEKYSGIVIEGCQALERDSEIREGLDYGKVDVKCDGENYTLVYANEYIYLKSSKDITAVFPDLISTIDLLSGIPLLSKDLSKGVKFNIVIIKRDKLKIGSGLKYPESYEQVVRAIGMDIRSYLKEFLVE